MRITALLAVAGAALGAGIAIVLHFVTRGYFRGDVGFPRRYADYLPTRPGGGPHPAWTPGVPLWAIGGLLVGAVIGGALGASGRLTRAQRITLLAPPAALGLLIGLAVGALIRLHDRTTTHHGRYVSFDQVGVLAYSSKLEINFDGLHDQWRFVLPVGGGIGLLAGVASGALAVLLRARVSGSSPSGSARR